MLLEVVIPEPYVVRIALRPVDRRSPHRLQYDDVKYMNCKSSFVYRE